MYSRNAINALHKIAGAPMFDAVDVAAHQLNNQPARTAEDIAFARETLNRRFPLHTNPTTPAQQIQNRRTAAKRADMILKNPALYGIDAAAYKKAVPYGRNFIERAVGGNTWVNKPKCNVHALDVAELATNGMVNPSRGPKGTRPINTKRMFNQGIPGYHDVTTAERQPGDIAAIYDKTTGEGHTGVFAGDGAVESANPTYGARRSNFGVLPNNRKQTFAHDAATDAQYPPEKVKWYRWAGK